MNCLTCTADDPGEPRQFIVVITCELRSPEWPEPETMILMRWTCPVDTIFRGMCTASPIALPRFAAQEECDAFIADRNGACGGTLVQSRRNRYGQHTIVYCTFDDSHIKRDLWDTVDWALFPVNMFVNEMAHASVTATYKVYPRYWTFHGMSLWLTQRIEVMGMPIQRFLASQRDTMDTIIMHENDALVIHRWAPWYPPPPPEAARDTPLIIECLCRKYPAYDFQRKWDTLCARSAAAPDAPYETLYLAKLLALRVEWFHSIDYNEILQCNDDSIPMIKAFFAQTLGYLQATSMTDAAIYLQKLNDREDHGVYYVEICELSKLNNILEWFPLDGVSDVAGEAFAAVFDHIIQGTDIDRLVRAWFEKLEHVATVRVPRGRILFHATLDRWPADPHKDVRPPEPWWHARHTLTSNGLYTSLFPAFSTKRMFWDPSEHDFAEHVSVRAHARSLAHPGALLAFGAKGDFVQFLDTSMTATGYMMWYEEFIEELLIGREAPGVTTRIMVEAYKVHFIAESGEQSAGERARLAILFWYCEHKKYDGFTDFSHLDPIEAKDIVPLVAASGTVTYDPRIDELRHPVSSRVYAREFVLCRTADVTILAAQNFGSIRSPWLVALALQARVDPRPDATIQCPVLKRIDEDMCTSSWFYTGISESEGQHMSSAFKSELRDYMSKSPPHQIDGAFLLQKMKVESQLGIFKMLAAKIPEDLYSHMECGDVWKTNSTPNMPDGSIGVCKYIHLVLASDIILTIISEPTAGRLWVGLLIVDDPCRHVLVQMPFTIHWFNLDRTNTTYTVINKNPRPALDLAQYSPGELQTFIENDLCIVGTIVGRPGWLEGRPEPISFMLDPAAKCFIPFSIPDWFYHEMIRTGTVLIGMGYDRACGLFFRTAQDGDSLRFAKWGLALQEWTSPPLPSQVGYTTGTVVVTQRLNLRF